MITITGILDPDWKFWHHGGEKLVLAVASRAVEKAGKALGDLAIIQGVPQDATWPVALDILSDVYKVRRLMVEGGGAGRTPITCDDAALGRARAPSLYALP